VRRHPNRRKILTIAGAAAVALAAAPAIASSTDMDGTITFEGGKAIPPGQLKITLEDKAVTDTALRRVAETTVKSDGSVLSIAFTLSPSVGFAPSPTLQIIARLERADGWLLARGSAEVMTGLPVAITLNTVLY